MSFEYESGSGSATANSGVDITYLEDYLDTRMIECCLDDDAPTQILIQQANLVKGTDYILGEYESKLLGSRLVETQRLLFPRVDSDGVAINDDNYKQAICKLTVKSYNLDADEELEADSDKRVSSEQLDVIKTSYDDYSRDEVLYNSVDSLMKMYLLDSSSSYNHSVCRT